MQKNQRPIDLSYRPSPWLRTIACVGLAALLTTGAVAGGRQEASADPAAERTPITAQENESSGNDQQPAPERDGPAPVIRQLDQPAWALVFHPTLDALQTEINEMEDDGYAPVGIEVLTDGAITILYKSVPEEYPRQWLLEDYTAETINNEITARLVQGWTPVGFSVVRDTYFVLYSPDDAEIKAWRIHQTPLDPDAIPGIIDAYRDEGYELVDFSLDPDTDVVWYLFVERPSPTNESPRLLVNAYPNGKDTAAGISVDYEAGRGMPDGIASGERLSFVLFRSEITSP